MDYVTKRYNTQKAGDEDANGSGKLTGTWCDEPLGGMFGFPSLKLC